MSLTLAHIALLIGAGLLAGAINASAGGGSLISFPALTLVGLSSLSANVSNTVALCGGYVGGFVGFREEIAAQRVRVRRLGIACGIGALIGVVLIEISSKDAFKSAVPYLLLLACGLLAIQPLVAKRLANSESRGRAGKVAEGLQLVAGAYGAYFGAGMGVMVLALLGMTSDEPMKQLNAIKAAIQLIVNVIAAICFIVIAPVDYKAVLILAPSSLIGGRVGADIAKRLPSVYIRTGVIVLGLIVAVHYLV